MTFSTTFPKARKPHQCYLCGGRIEKGEEHRKDVGYYGDFYSMRTHTACFALTKDWGADEWEYHDVFEFKEMREGMLG